MRKHDAYLDALESQTATVFCKDCRFFQEGDASVCQHPHALRERKTWKGVETVRLFPEDRNAQNDCPDWKAKPPTQHVWWRSWARIALLALVALVLLGIWLSARGLQ